MRLLITGAAGFTGRAVLRAAADRRLRLALHRTALPAPHPEDAEITHVDVVRPGTLRSLCTGVTAVVHLAAWIGGDPERCEAVNHQGTVNLLREAGRAGVGRFVYLSTAAVYGEGVHRRVGEDDLVPAPCSATSRSRHAAERAVLAAGGIVLRPFLVYGAGDAWVVPTVAALLGHVPAVIAQGRARLSMISVDDLARLIVALATGPWPPGRAVYHANHPVPVRSGQLMAAVANVIGRDRPSMDLSYEEYVRRLPPGAPSARQVSLLAFDHWYESSAVWTDSRLRPGPGFRQDFANYATWYRGNLRR